MQTQPSPPMLFIRDPSRPITIVTGTSVRAFKSGVRQMHIRAKALRRERHSFPRMTLELVGLM